MCKCNPQIKTPYCGAIGCEWPLGLFERCELTEQEVSCELTEQEVSKVSEVNLSDAVIKVMHEIDKGNVKNINVKIDCELLAPALAAKDAEIALVRNTYRLELDKLKSELAEKDAVLEFYGDHNNYNHFPATSDANCMDFVGFIEEKEAGDKAREVLQKYRKSEG